MAFAGCMNLVDSVDVDKMLAGEPHGKQVLGCTTRSCDCIDGVVFEISKRDKSGAIVVDQDKVNARDLAKAAAALAAAQKQERIEAIKASMDQGTATDEDKADALKLLLEKL